ARPASLVASLCVCSSYMTLRPPTSTLFPYTTLFRSLHVDRRNAAGGGAGWRPDPLRRDQCEPAAHHSRRSARRGFRSRRTRASEDRKSTRLNSSHVKISYAVFCLKKKKTRTHHNTTQ